MATITKKVDVVPSEFLAPPVHKMKEGGSAWVCPRDILVNRAGRAYIRRDAPVSEKRAGMMTAQIVRHPESLVLRVSGGYRWHPIEPDSYQGYVSLKFEVVEEVPDQTPETE